MAKATDRMELRVEPERAKLIRYAASLSHASVSAFVVDAASERAQRLIEDQRRTVVSSTYFDQVLAALDAADDEPNEALTRAAKARAAARRSSR
jgi:uncharacterized protein (DUF1778 family)